MTAGRSRRAVMLVTPNLDIGGAQETVRMLAAYLPRHGHPVVVCSFADGPLRTDIERLGVPVEVLPDRRFSVVALPRFVVEMVRLRLALAALIRRHRVDVVQTQGLGTLDFLVMTLRAHRGLQVWWTIQNANFVLRADQSPGRPWLFRVKRRAHRLLYRVGARVVTGVIAVSDATADSFRAVVGDAGEVVVVCNAVDLDRFPASIDRDRLRAGLGIAPDDHVMTMVGTFKRQKGHHELVEAVAKVAPRHPELTVVLVGDGELLEDVRARVVASAITEQVRFLGTRRDVPEILAASDSFVLPSLWEGLSVALVEAMASGLPVVATDVSGTAQVMVDGETGWLVPPGDPSALASAIDELLDDPASARRMADGARVRARQFGADAQAAHLSAMFARVPERSA